MDQISVAASIEEKYQVTVTLLGNCIVLSVTAQLISMVLANNHTLKYKNILNVYFFFMPF